MATVSSQARVWRQKILCRTARFPREPGANPWGTGAVLWRITAYDDMPYIFVLSRVFRITLLRRCHTFRLPPLTMQLQPPGPDHGRRRPEQAAKRRKAFGVIWPLGIMGTRGLAAAAGTRAALSTTSTSSLPTLPRLKPHSGHASLPPERNTATGELDRLQPALGRRVGCALAGTLPGPSCASRLTPRKQKRTMSCPAWRHPARHLLRRCWGRWCRCAGHSRSRR